MSVQPKGIALVTGASSGIGAVYADRLARRGHDLVLVARDETRLNTLAERLRAQAGVKVEVLRADLSDKAGLTRVEQRLGQGDIALLVNNAGAANSGGFAQIGPDRHEALIQLNVVVPTRLVSAFLAQGKGAVINIASVLAVAPEIGMPVYNGTKAFILVLSQSLQTEFAGNDAVYIQAVLPAATRTEIWERAGIPIENLREGSVMDAGDMVDAALVGFDRREAVTIPPLADEGLWTAFQAARQAMLPQFGSDKPAPRYLPDEAPFEPVAFTFERT
jgi:short-subunit dehydrogenase